MSDLTKVTGTAFLSVYVDDFQKAFAFYHDVLGLKKQFDMGENACFFGLDDDLEFGLYLQGGNKTSSYNEDTQRASFVLSVPSAGKLYEKLSELGIRMIQSEPIQMSEKDFWFQCYDPCGNIIEFLGDK